VQRKSTGSWFSAAGRIFKYTRHVFRYEFRTVRQSRMAAFALQLEIAVGGWSSGMESSFGPS
jgi:hypothetical protein